MPVSAKQIATVNGINTAHRLENEGKLEVLLPCACSVIKVNVSGYLSEEAYMIKYEKD